MRGAIFLAILAATMATQGEAARKKAPRLAPAPSAIEPPDSVVSVTPAEDGTVLIVKGWLDVGSFVKFRRVLAANPGVKTVRLISAGGLIQEGGLLASTIRDASLDTSVETICASACTLALAAGIERSAATEAWIGFHHARWIPREGMSGDHATEADPDVFQRGILRRAGIDPVFINTALNVPSDGIWFPDRTTLIDAKVLTRASAVPSRQDLDAIKAETVAVMRGSRLWAAAEREAASEFAKAFQLAWRLRTTGLDDDAIMAEAQSGLVRAILPRIASAPEPLAGAFLESMAKADPSACNTTGWGMRLPAPAQQTEQAELLTHILAQEGATVQMPLAEARRTLRKLMAKAAVAFPGLRRSSDAELRCRAGLNLVKRIAALEGDKRHRAFRAYAMLQESGELPAYAIPA